jgi:integrase
MRKVGVQRGSLRKHGPSWLVEFREYARGADGKPLAIKRCERVGPCIGPQRMTKAEAQREANVRFLDDVNRRNLKPSSAMTVEDFIETKFMTQVVEKRKKSGRAHYDYILRRFILPTIGQRRLCDVDVDAVEAVLAGIRAINLSWQTAKHAQNVISRIFRLARKLKLYHDENPAHDVEPGEKPVIKKRSGYTWAQASIVLGKLTNPAYLMAKVSIVTSLGPAEMCGLRLANCNFTGGIKETEDGVLGPYCLGIRENWYRGERGSLKTGKRCRNVPITPELAVELETYVAGRDKFTGPDDPLFSSRNGTPLDGHNIANRIFLPLAAKLGFPVTWYGFRRAHSTFAGQLDNISVEDRRATMGHADAEMSLYYSLSDVERRRAIPVGILERLKAEAERAAKAGVSLSPDAELAISFI